MKKELQYILAILFTSAIIFTAVYMPKLFAETESLENIRIESRAERAALALRYIDRPESSGGADKLEIEILDGRKLKEQMSEDVLEEILQKFDMLTSDFLAQPIDWSVYYEDIDIDGSLRKKDLVVIRDDQGKSFRILRFLLGWDTDWKNWIQVVFDADTGEIYFFYSSALCNKNHADYENLILPVDPVQVAEALKPCLGFDKYSIYWNGDIEEFAEITFENNSERVIYSIKCNYVPSSLFDCKVIMRE